MSDEITPEHREESGALRWSVRACMDALDEKRGEHDHHRAVAAANGSDEPVPLVQVLFTDLEAVLRALAERGKRIAELEEACSAVAYWLESFSAPIQGKESALSVLRAALAPKEESDG